MEQIGSHVEDFHENLYLSIFQKSIQKIQVLKSDNNISHEDQNTFLIISRSVLLTMRNVSDERCTQIQNTFYVQQLFFPRSCTFYEIMWEIFVEPDR